MESDSLAPFQKVHIDLTGPHRRSAGRHVYLLTGICWLYQVPRCGSSQRQECTYCGECITETWLSDLWCGGTPSPRQWNWVCKLDFSAPIQNDGDSGSQKHRLSPRSELSDRTHSPNTQCCIHKKTIKEHQRDWHEQAKYVCFAYNTAKHSSTTSSRSTQSSCESPRLELICFWINRSRFIKIPISMPKQSEKESKEPTELSVNSWKLLLIEQKDARIQRIREVRFKLNSYVWFYCPKLQAGRGRKFRKLTDGPYRIIRILNDVNYVIQNHPGKSTTNCHVDRLLKYEGETPRAWLKFDIGNAKEQVAAEPVPRAFSGTTGTIDLRQVRPIVKRGQHRSRWPVRPNQAWGSKG